MIASGWLANTDGRLRFDVKDPIAIVRFATVRFNERMTGVGRSLPVNAAGQYCRRAWQVPPVMGPRSMSGIGNLLATLGSLTAGHGQFPWRSWSIAMAKVGVIPRKSADVGARAGLTGKVLIFPFTADHLQDQQIGTGPCVTALRRGQSRASSTGQL